MRSIAGLAVSSAILLCAGCGSGGRPANDASGAPADGFAPAVSHAHAVVWAVGDAAPGPGGRAVARLVSRARGDLFLYLGDVYPLGTASAFRTAYAPLFGTLAPKTAPTPGNHDWPVHVQGYDRYWRAVRGRTPPSWYSFVAGGWRVIAINSELGPDAAQLRWLRRTLRRPGTCRLAFWHEPRFSAGPHGDDPAMDDYWRALEGHATLVLSGHDHVMERLRPRAGLTQLVSGAGGHSHYRLRHDPRLAFGDDRHWGALRLDLRPRTARAAFVATNGRRLDAKTLDCTR